MKPLRIGILGLGRFGLALQYSLSQLGHEVWGRGPDEKLPLNEWAAHLTVLCLAVRDDQIAPLMPQLALSDLTQKTVLIHSGITPLSLLEPLKAKGAIIGKLHPLQTFAVPRKIPIPKGTPFAFEGDIISLVRPWVEAWQGELHELQEDQWVLYHLAAVTAANFLPLFIRAGARLLEPLSASSADSLAWLAPLIRASTESALDAENPLPFSGPAIRRDKSTLEKHEQCLAKLAPDLLPLYQHASEQIARLSKTDGAPSRPRKGAGSSK